MNKIYTMLTVGLLVIATTADAGSKKHKNHEYSARQDLYEYARVVDVNPIYREVIPRALTSVTEMYLPVDERVYVRADGGLDFGRLLDDWAGR